MQQTLNLFITGTIGGPMIFNVRYAFAPQEIKEGQYHLMLPASLAPREAADFLRGIAAAIEEKADEIHATRPPLDDVHRAIGAALEAICALPKDIRERMFEEAGRRLGSMAVQYKNKD
jgi:hypothetical protein